MDIGCPELPCGSQDTVECLTHSEQLTVSHRRSGSRDVMRRRPAKYVTLVTGCVARAAARRTHRTPGSAAAVAHASAHPDRASRPPKKSPTMRPTRNHL